MTNEKPHIKERKLRDSVLFPCEYCGQPINVVTGISDETYTTMVEYYGEAKVIKAAGLDKRRNSEGRYIRNNSRYKGKIPRDYPEYEGNYKIHHCYVDEKKGIALGV